MPSFSRIASRALVSLVTVVTITARSGSARAQTSAPGPVVVTVSSAGVTAAPPPLAPSPPAEPEAQPRSTRTALAWTGIIGGGALLVAGGILGVVFESSRSTLDSDRRNNYGNGAEGATIEDPCDPAPGEANATTSSGCSARRVARAVIIPEIAALSAGGALAILGIALLVSDRKHEPSNPVALLHLSRLRLLPELGVRGASLRFSASF